MPEGRRTQALALWQKLAADYPAGNPVTWDAFLGVAARKTSQTYRSHRDSLLKSPGTDTETRNLLRGQTDQRPQAFVKSVRTVR